jgi:hypothetical protein
MAEIEIEFGGERPPRVVDRTVKQRTSHERTEADARTASPEPAERAEPAREASLPESEMPRRTRKPREERQIGGLQVPEHLKKPGWDYQFIVIRVLNDQVDWSEIREYQEGGWTPCKARDWPTLAAPNAKDDDPIDMRGQRLFERPVYLTREAQQEDLAYAQQQQRDKMIAAASGQSAVRGEEGMPRNRAVRPVPVQISLEGVAG